MQNATCFNIPSKASFSFQAALDDVLVFVSVSLLSSFIIFSTFVALLSRHISFIQLLFLLFAVLFLVSFLWATLTRSFEVNPVGIIYLEAFRAVRFRWDEIDTVHIESWKKQITFRVNGKTTRIHMFGLDRNALASVQEAFLFQIKEHGISLIE